MFLKKTIFDTPLGKMMTVSSETVLFSLSFVDQVKNPVQGNLNVMMMTGETQVSGQIQRGLDAYFHKKEWSFKAPIFLGGTAFQQAVWNLLGTISLGETQCYENLAQAMNHPQATRAIANAIGKNPFSIIIPCHRIIRKNGELGGYNGGVDRKKWLLAHEGLR